MRYKNSGRTTKTFYGITFRPGDIKDVPGYINTSSFIPVPVVENSSTNKTNDFVDTSAEVEPANLVAKVDKKEAKKVDDTKSSSYTKSNQLNKQTTNDVKQEDKKSESKSDNKKQDESKDDESKDKNK